MIVPLRDPYLRDCLQHLRACEAAPMPFVNRIAQAFQRLDAELAVARAAVLVASEPSPKPPKGRVA